MYLYLTADRVGTPTGGGAVTFYENEALRCLGKTHTISREELEGAIIAADNRGQFLPDDPWIWDSVSKYMFGDQIKLCHLYAGTFSDSVEKLKRNGAKVVYTAAAHNIEVSKREHEKLGMPFNYPHLVEPSLWQKYVKGYLDADVLVCPSQYSADIMRSYGATNRIEVIPHGIPDVPKEIARPPSLFTVGYLGSYGPDKGVIYLLQAWKKLNYQDAVLVLAGKDSTHKWVHHFIEQYGGGNIILKGWVENTSDFYNSISVYVQPSASEGFGIEVLEAMAHGRPVICSHGAGAADLLMDTGAGFLLDKPISHGYTQLPGIIDLYKHRPEIATLNGNRGAELAKDYTWDKIQQRYISLWRSLL